MASFSKTKQCKTKQGNHLLTAQLLPWSYRMPTEIVYKCIKPCLRVYRFFILIPFVVFYKLFKALWAQFLREEGGLLSPFQILVLGSGSLPGDFFSTISFIFGRLGVHCPWALAMQFIRQLVAVKVQKQSCGVENTRKFQRQKLLSEVF